MSSNQSQLFAWTDHHVNTIVLESPKVSRQRERSAFTKMPMYRLWASTPKPLYVRVLQPALHYELEQISESEILRKLKQRFGGKTIRDVRFRVG
jgi:hypothetical protein